MAYELYNPHIHSIRCTLGRPIGELLIEPNECLPTPEQETDGLKAKTLEDFVCPNLLHETPPALRRRLLLEEGLDVPKDLVERTKHLPEFGGTPSASEATGTSVRPSKAKPAGRKVKHVYTDKGKAAQTRTPSLEEEMQQAADRMSSSGRVKKADNPK